MPMKAKHPCNHPGCPELVSGRFCDKHRKEDHQHYNRHQRDPEAYKQYGTEWRRIRARYVARHPLCELCRAAGRLRPTEEVHHKVPLRDGGTHAEDNLQALCKRCHSGITAREGGRWAPGGGSNR